MMMTYHGGKHLRNESRGRLWPLCQLQVHLHVSAHTQEYIHVQAHTCTHMFIRTCTHIHLQAHTDTHIHSPIRIQAYTRTHVYTYTYTRTYIHMLALSQHTRTSKSICPLTSLSSLPGSLTEASRSSTSQAVFLEFQHPLWLVTEVPGQIPGSSRTWRWEGFAGPGTRGAFIGHASGGSRPNGAISHGIGARARQSEETGNFGVRVAEEIQESFMEELCLPALHFHHI